MAAWAVLALIANFAPADFWGECRHEICVYHAMFCEPTRHASIVRHPSNFWSNLPYVYTSFYLLILLYGERSSGSARAFQLLDALFAVVLFSLALASFTWHGSNCPIVHWVDIGLMNCTIVFFPFRFGSSRQKRTCNIRVSKLLPRTLDSAANAEFKQNRHTD